MTRVLLCEDEPVVRKVLVRILEKSGYDVVAAADGATARTLGRVDVAVLDKNLPDGSGIDLAAALLKDDPALPVIILSGFASDAAARAALNAGVWEFLRKPLGEVREIAESVASAVTARHEGRTGPALGTRGGPVLLIDEGARGDALATAIVRARHRVERRRPEEAIAELARGGVRAVVVGSSGGRAQMVGVLQAARAATPRVPAVVMAARGALEDVLAAMRAGACGFLVDAEAEEVVRRIGADR
jgi:DNA-binding NtrC family response regulator